VDELNLGGIASTAKNWEKVCDFEGLEWSETEITKYKVTHLTSNKNILK